MADTSQRPRTGAQWIMQERPSSLFYDSWAVCPWPKGCTCCERDGTAWWAVDRQYYVCANGHFWDASASLWEVEPR